MVRLDAAPRAPTASAVNLPRSARSSASNRPRRSLTRTPGQTSAASVVALARQRRPPRAASEARSVRVTKVRRFDSAPPAHRSPSRSADCIRSKAFDRLDPICSLLCRIASSLPGPSLQDTRGRGDAAATGCVPERRSARLPVRVIFTGTGAREERAPSPALGGGPTCSPYPSYCEEHAQRPPWRRRRSARRSC
jgi:hypothetical protein